MTLARDLLPGSAKRGYVLMEAMIGGAILALVLSATFSIIAQARADVVYAQRKQAAGSLCRQLVEDLSTQQALTASSGGPMPVDAVNYPGITYDFTVVDNTSFYNGLSPSPGGVSSGKFLYEITVNVHYPSATGTKTFSEKILRER
jgi:hypothetical protein